MKKLKEEKVEIVVLPRQTLWDNCRKIDAEQISLGFQLVNPVTFDIENLVLSSLKEKSFDRQEIIDPWEYLAKFYKICSMCKPSGDISDDQVKLHLLGFSLIGHTKEWLQCILNGTIQTWKELKDKFLERYYSNA